MIETKLALPLRLRIDDLGNLNVASASLMALFDSSLNALNDCSLSRSFWTAFFLWMTCDSPNQLKNVKVFGTFHRFFRNARDVEVNVPIVRRKVKLVHIITTFEMIVFLHCVLFFPLFQVSLSHRDFGHVVLPLSRVSPFCRKNLVLLATH